jgi:hypothetical protein
LASRKSLRRSASATIAVRTLAVGDANMQSP